jgi:hypothetical protein
MDGPVGEPNMEGISIGGRVGGDGLDAELAAGADDTHRHLSSVRDEDAPEHQRAPAARSARAKSAQKGDALGTVRRL